LNGLNAKLLFISSVLRIVLSGPFLFGIDVRNYESCYIHYVTPWTWVSPSQGLFLCEANKRASVSVSLTASIMRAIEDTTRHGRAQL